MSAALTQASSRQPAASLARAYPVASCVLPAPGIPTTTCTSGAAAPPLSSFASASARSRKLAAPGDSQGVGKVPA